MSRPTIFISSTVHDFGDMRSALKDYLETRGCKVLSSEFADFPRSLDKHSYQECLDTIGEAHVFVLLIGKRLGGWYDERKGISITRAEFERAVTLAQAGRLRILTFVRKEVLDYHQANKELRKKLANHPSLDEAQRDDIVYRDTPLMDNPRGIMAFIEAVTRNHETAAAVRGIGTAPVANWIQPFSGFAEVRQAIEPLITGGFEVSKAAAQKALEIQLLMLLQAVLPAKVADSRVPIDRVRSLVDRTGLEPETDDDVRLEGGTFATLTELAAMTSDAWADPDPLQHALESDLLLDFDPATSAFEETAEYLLLARIIAGCNALNRAGDRSADLLVIKKGIRKGQGAYLPQELVRAQLTRLMRWADLVSAVRSLARALRGGPLETPPSLPLGPERRAPETFAHQVTLAEARAFVDAWVANY